MKRLSRDKRNQLVTVIVVILAVLGLIYFSLIKRQYDSINKIAKDKKNASTRLLTIKSTITNNTAIANELQESAAQLQQVEADMASGDLYSWTVDTIRRFRQSYRVDIPDVGPPTVGDMNLLPGFPYKQIRFAISGTAYYHDLGKFIADFENNYPRIRLVNLTVEPVSSTEGTEKLRFRLEIIALVKPNPS